MGSAHGTAIDTHLGKSHYDAFWLPADRFQVGLQGDLTRSEWHQALRLMHFSCSTLFNLIVLY